jgi:DUF4097 and DUF4098 domain-containing protein YvlB
MMTRKLILMVLIILLALFGFGRDGDAKSGAGQAIQKIFDVPAGKTLDIDLKSGGPIRVKGREKPRVEIAVRFKNGDADDWKITYNQTEEGIVVESRYTGKGFKNIGSPAFDIIVPTRFNLKIRTMGGEITIDGVEGKFTGKTMGGNLTLSRLKGNIDLKTMGGDISLTDSDIDGALKTMGGRVLFENVVGNVKGSSMGGNVVYKNVKPRSGAAAGSVLSISTMGGAINVSDAPHGAQVSTMGGDIQIKSAREFIKAKTMGGNIVIDAIDGWVKATTMGGDVRVTMNGDPDKGDRHVTLSSMGGEISLTVPRGLSMDIELELSYTKDSSKKYKIVSDFEIREKEAEQWEDGKGSPRKYLYGTAKIKGGKHKIKIKTINGNIYLKEK